MEKPNGKSRRGFASMDKDKHKAVSRKGGQGPKIKEREVKTRSSYDGF